MPSFNIVKRSKIPKSYRTEYVIGKFDLDLNEEVTETFQGEIPYENKEWNVGLIVGGSGTGKTSIAKQLFSEVYSDNSIIKDKTIPIIQAVGENKSMDTVLKTFNKVGLNTVWTYLKPFNVLSNGEKMRVELAEALLSDEELIVFDEFTSVVDRTVAKTCCINIHKVMKNNHDKKIIFVSCHRDIVDFLRPDWIYDTDIHEFISDPVKKNQNYHSEYIQSLENEVKGYGSILASIII